MVMANESDPGSAPEPPRSRRQQRLRRINVEPIAFLFSASAGILSSIFAPFVYFKSCIELHRSLGQEGALAFCKELEQANATEAAHLEQDMKAVQQLASQNSMILLIVTTLPALFASFFAGWQSDRHGRKLFIVLSIFGTTISHTVTFMAASWPLSPMWLLYVASVVTGVFGSGMTVFLLATAALRDTISDDKQLSIRYSILASCGSAGQLIGHFANIFLVQYLGYADVMLIALCFMVACFLYAVLFFQETVPTRPRQHNNRRGSSKDLASVSDSSRQGDSIVGPGSATIQSAATSLNKCGGRLAYIWRSTGIAGAIRILLAKRTNARVRLHLVVGLLSWELCIFAASGCVGLMLLFCKLPPLSWSDSLYVLHSAYATAISAVGVPALTHFCKRVLNLSDLSLILIGQLSSIFNFIFISLSRETWQLFAASILSFSGITFVSYRSFLVKLVPKEEAGRLSSLVAAIESLGPLMSSVVFNEIYQNTLDVFPGMVFEISAALMLLGFAAVAYLLFDTKRQQKMQLQCIMNDVDDNATVTIIPECYESANMSQ